MKTTIKLFCGLMAIALAACTHNELPQVEPSEKPAGGRVVSVKAYTPDGQAESRLAFDEQSGSLAMTWTEGDAFEVTINEAEVRFTYDATKEAFTATLPEGAELEDEMRAYYPAGRDGLDVQSGKLDGKATFMQGTYSAATNSFTFRHTTAILKATFSGVPNNADISSVRVGIGLDAINVSAEDLELDGVYIYLPANNNTAVAQGQKMVFAAETEDGDIYTATQTVQKAEGIEAGKFYTADIALTKIPYVTFTAQFAGQKLKYTGTNLQYSTDAVVWTPFNGTDDVDFGAENKLYLRGDDNSIGTCFPPFGVTYKISFSDGNNKVACTGDIRTLLDYETYDTVGTGGAMFPCLFEDCIALTSAPALPATVLNESCYQGMFAGCTSLTAAPELPAETLTNYCYYEMFNGCTSLTAAPELPATVLTQGCYQNMFAGCTSLTAAPELPAEILKNVCYNEMFKGCTSLSSVTMLATDVSAGYCLDSWLDGVADSGTLYVDANNVTEFTSNKVTYGIPESWTVTAYTPQP